MTSLASALKQIEEKLSNEKAGEEVIWRPNGFSEGFPKMVANKGSVSAEVSLKNGVWGYHMSNGAAGSGDNAEEAMKEAGRLLSQRNRQRLDDAKKLFMEYGFSLVEDTASKRGSEEMNAVEMVVKSLVFLSKSKAIDEKISSNPKLKSVISAAERFFEKKENNGS